MSKYLNKPFVAVIMSVYIKDNLVHLSESLNSLLNQTYSNYCIYIYTDGPLLDDVNSYLQQLKDTNKIYLIIGESNIGLAPALNCIIDTILESNIEVKYFLRMDADDISFLDRIEKQVDFMELNTDIGVSGGFCQEFGSSFALSIKELPLEHANLSEFSLYRCPFIHPTVIFRDSVFKSGIRYPEDTSFTEDMALWLQLLETGFKFANLSEVLIKYRLNEEAVTRRMGFRKGLSEFTVRIRYMFKSRNFLFIPFLKVCIRLVFHILPVPVVKYLYKSMR